MTGDTPRGGELGVGGDARASRLDAGTGDREREAPRAQRGRPRRLEAAPRAGRKRDPSFAPCPPEVPASRREAQRAARLCRQREVHTRHRPRERRGIQGLRSQVQVGARRGLKGQRTLSVEPAAEPARRERLHHQARALHAADFPVALQGPTPAIVSARDVASSLPVTRSSATSTAASASIRPSRPLPGASASTSAPSMAARAEAVAVIGRTRSTRPASSRLEAEAVTRACSTTSTPPSSESVASPCTGVTRRPPSGQPMAPSPIRSDVRRLAPAISRSTRPSTSQGAPLASCSSSRPSTTSARPSRSSTRQGCAASPLARGLGTSGTPLSVTTTCGRRSVSCGPEAGDHSTAIPWTSIRAPGSARLTAVAPAWPRHRARSSWPIRKGPPTAREPQDSTKARSAVRPGGVCSRPMPSAANTRQTIAKRTTALRKRRTRERRSRGNGASGATPSASGSPPDALTT